MRIGITGALGHIGSRLIRSLKAGRFDGVLLIDDLSTQRYSSLFNLPSGVSYDFVEADILTADLDRLFEGFDVVIHLAAITDAESSVSIPDRVMNVNVDGTRRVASACARLGCRLLFLSTTSVYGVQAEEVDEECSEEDLRPQSPYAESKLLAERLLTEMGETENLLYTTCRFGTIFGPSPGMRFHTAVNRFIWQALLGRPLTVWSAAMDQKRPYLDLSDAINAIHFIIERDLFDGRLYNVVTTNATVRQIVDIISSTVEDVTTTLVDSKIMNQLSYDVSSARFEREGFVFSGALEAGIRETVELLRGVRSTGTRA